MPSTVESLFWIALCAVLAPLVAGSVLRRKVPEVVLLLVLGVLIGPNVLDLAVTDEGIDVLRELGLGMLFLLAGYEIEIEELVGRGRGVRCGPGLSRLASRWRSPSIGAARC